jgi:hypothetical protein
MKSMKTDEEIIKSLGGPAKVAELLGYEKDGGTQRVHNWIARGIPSHVKVERPDLFMPNFVQKAA